MTQALADLGKRYGTDKENAHDFLRYYDSMFGSIRDGVKKVLEIGILQVASLKMWRDYFPAAQVIGADADKRIASADYGERVTTVLADQSKPEDLEELAAYGPYDIIVDDGSHKSRHQQLTFGKLFKHLKPNGIFIIEDLHTSILPRWVGDARITTMDMLFKLMQDGIVESDDICAEDQTFINQNVRAVMMITTRFRQINSITGSVQRKPTE